MNNWKKLSSKIVYRNPWITVHEDQVVRPDGTKGIYSYVETPPSVYAVPVDMDNNTYLIQLYRYTTKKLSWEVPGGRSDGQVLEEAARRELQEETGLAVKELVEVGTFDNLNGLSVETSHVFLAKELHQTHESEKKEEGIVSVKRLPFNEVFELIQKGEITDSQSINALLLVAFSLGYSISRS